MDRGAAKRRGRLPQLRRELAREQRLVEQQIIERQREARAALDPLLQPQPLLEAELLAGTRDREDGAGVEVRHADIEWLGTSEAHS